MENNPYATPKARLQAEPIQHAQRSQVTGPYGPYRNNGFLRTILIILILLDTGLAIYASGYLNHLDIQQYGNADYLISDEYSEVDAQITYFESARISVYFITIIFFCIWTNRICKNGWLLDPPKMQTTPGWAVGYHFIPILSLWKPFVAMREIRAATLGQSDHLKAILGLWWTFWILSQIVGTITGLMYGRANTQSDYLSACKLTYAHLVVELVLAYAVIGVIYGITRAQDERAAHWRD